MANSITSAVALSPERDIIGFGLVKLYAEAVMVLDLAKDKKLRLSAMDLLMKEALRSCVENHIGQLHVHVADARLARLLARKYAFEYVTDHVLVLEV